MRSLFKKKQVYRALIMTICLVSYLTVFNKLTPNKGLALTILMIASCFLLDYVMIRLLRSKYLVKIFFEEKKS